MNNLITLSKKKLKNKFKNILLFNNYSFILPRVLRARLIKLVSLG